MIGKIYEPETQALMKKVLKEGDNFVIAGAHRGVLSSVAASLVGPKGHGFLFEPESENYQILTETMKCFSNIKIFNHALGDRECEAKFFINDDNNGGHALWDVSLNLYNLKSQKNRRVKNVRVRKLDNVLEEEGIESLKLILFDMEGAEHSALKGSINTIVDLDVPYIISEINGLGLRNCGTTQILLRSFMKAYGYREYGMDGKKTDVSIDKELFAYNEKDGEVVFNILFSRNGIS